MLYISWRAGDPRKVDDTERLGVLSTGAYRWLWSEKVFIDTQPLRESKVASANVGYSSEAAQKPSDPTRAALSHYIGSLRLAGLWGVGRVLLPE
jgi:hypothetical protein